MVAEKKKRMPPEFNLEPGLDVFPGTERKIATGDKKKIQKERKEGQKRGLSFFGPKR